LDKVTATTDTPQHHSKDFGLPRAGLDGFQRVFVVREIERVVHGFKYG